MSGDGQQGSSLTPGHLKLGTWGSSCLSWGKHWLFTLYFLLLKNVFPLNVILDFIFKIAKSKLDFLPWACKRWLYAFLPPSLRCLLPQFLMMFVLLFLWYFVFVLRRKRTTWFLRALSLTLKKGWAQLLRLLWASPSLVLSFAGRLWAKLLWYLISAFSHVY